MKKYLFLALMTFVMVGFVSCKKDTDLSGTKWKATQTETIEGVTLTVETVIEFTSETDGKLTSSAMSMTYTETFTYTYDGKGKGTMTGKDEQGVSVTTDFTIDGDDLTLKTTDEETGAPITIVFKKQ